MSDKIEVMDKLGVQLVRARRSVGGLEIHGTYRLEHFRGGELIGKYEFPNLVTTEGKNHLLNVAFKGAAQISTWYVALVNNVNTKNGGNPVAPLITHAYDSFFDPAGAASTNTEYIDYVEGSNFRIAYVPGTVSAGTITNVGTKASFTFETSPGVLYGACLVSGQGQGTHVNGGVLMSYSRFQVNNVDATVPVAIGDVINVEIEIAFS